MAKNGSATPAGLMTPVSAVARSFDDDSDGNSIWDGSDDDEKDNENDKEDEGDISGDDINSDTDNESNNDKTAGRNPPVSHVAQRQKPSKTVVWRKINSDTPLVDLLETLQMTIWNIQQAEQELRKAEQDLQEVEARERKQQKAEPDNQEKQKLAQRKNNKQRRRDKAQTILDSHKDLLNRTEADLRPKEVEHQQDIEDCVKSDESSDETFSHSVLVYATSSSLRVALFVLKLILKVAPSQISSSSRDIPLLHKAIEVELEHRNKPVAQNFTGLTSEICKLARELCLTSHINEAIAATNGSNENCIHLVIQHEIYDAQSIIGLVGHGSDPAVFMQKRMSAIPGENENTPLHDALNFKRVARHGIPCDGLTHSRQKGLCSGCKSSKDENKRFPDPALYYDTIVGPLVKGCPGVLKQQNATGHSPYTYHWETRTRSIDDLKIRIKSSAAEQSILSVNESVNSKGSNSQSQTDTKKTKKGPFVLHPASYDLRPSEYIVAQLEEWIDSLNWRYEDFIDCLFPGDRVPISKHQDKRKSSCPSMLRLFKNLTAQSSAHRTQVKEPSPNSPATTGASYHTEPQFPGI